MTRTFTAALVDQLDFYLAAHLLPRLEGLTDEEYFWEPVADCWSVRPGGGGGWRLDEGSADDGGEHVEHVTTIAWRLADPGFERDPVQSMLQSAVVRRRDEARQWSLRAIRPSRIVTESGANIPTATARRPGTSSSRAARAR